jgi:hypothetical protein
MIHCIIIYIKGNGRPVKLDERGPEMSIRQHCKYIMSKIADKVGSRDISVPG